MKLGFCSISALDRSLSEAARAAADAGFQALEVTQRAPHFEEHATLEQARDAGRAARDAGLEVVAHGSYLGREGERTPERARHEVALAAAMGAPLLRVWAEPLPDLRDEGFAEAVALLRHACVAAAGEGITVVVERHIGSFADTPKRIERLFDAVDRPALALNYQVLDLLTQDALSAQPDDAAALVPLARYLHLKNYRPNPDGGPLLPGGSLEHGAIDYQALLAAVLEAGYEGPMTLEFLSFEPIPLEEKLAQEIAYLRRVLAALGRPLD